MDDRKLLRIALHVFATWKPVYMKDTHGRVIRDKNGDPVVKQRPGESSADVKNMEVRITQQAKKDFQDLRNKFSNKSQMENLSDFWRDGIRLMKSSGSNDTASNQNASIKTIDFPGKKGKFYELRGVIKDVNKPIRFYFFKPDGTNTYIILFGEVHTNRTINNSSIQRMISMASALMQSGYGNLSYQ